MPIGFGLEMQMHWKQPKTSGDKPTARSGHTLSLCGEAGGSRTMVMFGGCFAEPAGPTDEVFTLDIGSYVWYKVPAATNAPGKRWRHSATVVGGNKVVVFGGFSEDARLNDVWVLDLDRVKVGVRMCANLKCPAVTKQRCDAH
jgi:hypothetical protein